MKRLAVEVLAGVALAALTFLVGRATAPTVVKDKQLSVVAEKVATEKRDETSAATAADARTIVKWRWHRVTRPDGTIDETREAVKADESHKATTNSAKSTVVRTETRERIVYRERESSTARPNWSIGAAAGAGLDLRPRYQADVARRLVGGLWLTVGVDASGRAALAGLRMEF